MNESIKRGLEQSAAGEVHDLGSFAQHTQETMLDKYEYMMPENESVWITFGPYSVHLLDNRKQEFRKVAVYHLNEEEENPIYEIVLYDTI